MIGRKRETALEDLGSVEISPEDRASALAYLERRAPDLIEMLLPEDE
jgi:hypothetical protein